MLHTFSCCADNAIPVRADCSVHVRWQLLGTIECLLLPDRFALDFAASDCYSWGITYLFLASDLILMPCGSALSGGLVMSGR